MDLVAQAGIDVSPWLTRKDGKTVRNPRANPHYCYEWAFGGNTEPSVFCIWHKNLKLWNGLITYEDNLRSFAIELDRLAEDRRNEAHVRSRARDQAKRARSFDSKLQYAYRKSKPSRVILLKGESAGDGKIGWDTSKVHFRSLDTEEWNVVFYNDVSGEFRVTRNESGTSRTINKKISNDSDVRDQKTINQHNDYSWVPFYSEMAESLLRYRGNQKELIGILKDAGVNGLTDQYPKGKKIALSEIDPFTFTNLINKHSNQRRTSLLKTIQERLGIKALVPIQFSGVPNVDSRQAWMFPYKYERASGDVDKLWKLYEEVVSKNRISEPVFSEAKQVKYAGTAKLTQAIFRAAPTKYFPIDGQTTPYLATLGLPNKFKSVNEYHDLCDRILTTTSEPLYEHSYKAWLSNQEPPNEAKYQHTALSKAVTNKKGRLIEPAGGLPIPSRSSNDAFRTAFQRDATVAAEAIKRADFKCELDPSHKTFISNAKGFPYVEAHHLIPISQQGFFAVSLDVTANIIALCPMCHRLLHHGKASDKNKHLVKLHTLRKDRLTEKEIVVGRMTLLGYYHGDLLEDDS